MVSDEKTNDETPDFAVFLQPPPTYSTSGPNIPLGTALSNILIMQTEPFIFSPGKAVLSHRKPASTETHLDSYRVQDSYKRNAIYVH